MPTSKEQPKDDFYEGYHVVALIDVLGQKQKLAEWAKLPPAVELTPELQKVLKSTVGTLLPFRDAFDDFFQQAAMTERRQRMLDALPAQAQQLYRRYLDCSLGIQQFSDTFVFYARLHDVHGDLSEIGRAHV